MDPIFNKIQDVYSSTKSVKKTSEILNISRTKVKKVLITLGLYLSGDIEKILHLLSIGYSKKEICNSMNISMSYLNESIPYTKGVYYPEVRSKQAIRSERFRIKETLYKKRFNKLKEERKNGKLLSY